MAISNCTWGGIVKKEPPEAPLSIETTAKPFLTFFLIQSKADVYVSSDFKYHDFFKAENSILLADIGHYESEQFTKNLLVEFLTKKFTNFAIVLSEKSTNPIYYL